MLLSAGKEMDLRVPITGYQSLLSEKDIKINTTASKRSYNNVHAGITTLRATTTLTQDRGVPNLQLEKRRGDVDRRTSMNTT